MNKVKLNTHCRSVFALETVRKLPARLFVFLADTPQFAKAVSDARNSVFYVQHPMAFVLIVYVGRFRR